jgi:hypothetical protein
MKYVLSGTAIAAALVIAAPVWAQTAAPMAPSSDKPMHHRVMHHRGHHHVVHHRGAGSSDNIANQLNAQQAARTAGGAMGGAPAPAYGRATGPYGQPNQVYGIRGAGQASPSSDYLSGPGPGYVPGSMVSHPNPYGQRSPTQGIPGAGQVTQSSDYPSGPGPAYVPGQYQVSPSPNAPAAR